MTMYLKDTLGVLRKCKEKIMNIENGELFGEDMIFN